MAAASEIMQVEAYCQGKEMRSISLVNEKPCMIGWIARSQKREANLGPTPTNSRSLNTSGILNLGEAMYISNLDKLVMDIDIQEYDNLFKDFLDKLEECKQSSKTLQLKGSTTKKEIIINNEYFFVYPNGNRGHAYILENMFYKYYFSQGKSSNQNFYPVSIDISSNALWNKSPLKAYDEAINNIRWVIENYNAESKNIIIRERISRVDLCCHTDDFNIDEGSINSFQGRAKKDNAIRKDKVIQTFQFGVRGGAIYCRIYNKTDEVLENFSKTWFIDIWQNRGMNISKVWNIEFELRRELLKENDINAFSDLYVNLKSLWCYCTSNWLVQKDQIYSRIERCPISKQWELIQCSYNDFIGVKYITRKKQVEQYAGRNIPALTGNITSYIAMHKDMSLEQGVNQILSEGKLYLQKAKGSSFESEIQNKRKKYWEVKQ